MPRSAGCLRSPRVLWRTPIDSSKEIAELCRTDRHDTVRRRRPQKTSALKTLREQTLPLSIVPQALDEITAPATKHEQVPVVRIALERLLNQQCQALVALPHIGVAGRQPNARMTYRIFRIIREGWRPRIWLNWRWLNATRQARGSRHVRRYTESAEQRHHD